MADDNFYQKQSFDQLSEQNAALQKELSAIRSDVSDIKAKIIYMYGFAAGVGIFASLIIDWFRTHIMGDTHG